MTGPVVGVLLAAGGGRRLGGRKPLVELGGRPLVAIAVQVLAEGGCEEVVVVTGAEPAAAEAALAAGRAAGVPVHPVHNPDWALGQATSLRVGLAAARSTSAAWALLHLVDLPGVGSGVVARLLDARPQGDDVRPEGYGSRPHGSEAEEGPRALVAAYDGRPRNPVLVTAEVLGDVAASAQGDQGARAWLRAHPDQVRLVECADLGAAEDIDTPEQLARWRTLWQTSPPSPDVVASGRANEET